MSTIPHRFAQKARQAGLTQGAKRDPELYVLLAIMTGTFSLVGFYFGRYPTMAQTEEGRINLARESAPWNAKDGEIENSDRGNYKYKYHPNADYRNPPKNAPGALHSVIVPNVTLPKEIHEKFNKYGKDNY